MGFPWNWEEMKPRGFRGVRVGGRRQEGRLRAATGVPAVETLGVSPLRAGRAMDEPQPRGTRLSEPLTPPSTSARAALTSPDPNGPVPAASPAAAAAVPQAPQNPPAPVKTFPINPQLRRGLRRHTLPAPAPPPVFVTSPRRSLPPPPSTSPAPFRWGAANRRASWSDSLDCHRSAHRTAAPSRVCSALCSQIWEQPLRKVLGRS